MLASASALGCGSAATSGLVPWANRPLPRYAIPEPKLIRYPTSAPACGAQQLRVSQGRSGVGLGNRLQELVFTNAGARPCLLRGYPQVSAETPSGSRRVLRPSRGGTYFGQLRPADLPPDGHVFLDFATSTGCGGGTRPPVRYRDLVFTLPDGESIRAKWASISAVCGLSMSEFGLPERYSQPRPAPGTAGTLRARLQVSPSVRAGTTLRYIVTLSNPTRVTVAFRPCPGYSEGFYALGLIVRRSFALNCDSVRTIPAHRHVRYAMRLALPRRAPAGMAKLGWNLNTPNGPFAVQVVRVVCA
jgi:Domain of unknown function (DUF4232)